MAERPACLLQALNILHTPDPATKAKLALQMDGPDADALRLCTSFDNPPDTPARPRDSVSPTSVRKRTAGSLAGRNALLHAVAHIELNAIDLAFDMIARFATSPVLSAQWRSEFVADWIAVGQDEARHFGLLTAILSARNQPYGSLPVHAGMWDAARNTSDSVLARLAIAPMVLEARGLDVTPPMIEKLDAAGDSDAVSALKVIYAEEVGHVAMGVKWFTRIARDQGLDPKQHFQELVRERFPGGLKPPFNDTARQQAGLDSEFYRELVAI